MPAGRECHRPAGEGRASEMESKQDRFDDAGRALEQARGEVRLAALTTDLTLTLLALECATSLVAGRHERAAFEAAGLTEAPPFADAGAEADPDWSVLAEQRPTHVFYHPGRNPPQVRERIEEIGARAIAVGPRRPADNLSAFEMLGWLLARTEAADLLIRRLEAEIARARMLQLHHASIASAYLARAEPLCTIAVDSYPDRMLALGGFASHGDPGGGVPIDAIREAEPRPIWLRPIDHRPFAAREVAVVLCSRRGGFRRAEMPALAQRFGIDRQRVRLLELDWPERDGVLAITALSELCALHTQLTTRDPLIGGGPRLARPDDVTRRQG